MLEKLVVFSLKTAGLDKKGHLVQQLIRVVATFPLSHLSVAGNKLLSFSLPIS